MRKLRHEEIPRPDPKTVHALSGHPVSVLLDNVRSIYNVGAMFRTSDAALVERLYLTGITGTPETAVCTKRLSERRTRFGGNISEILFPSCRRSNATDIRSGFLK